MTEDDIPAPTVYVTEDGTAIASHLEIASIGEYTHNGTEWVQTKPQRPVTAVPAKGTP